MTTKAMTAVFPNVERATAFEKRLDEGRDRSSNVKRKGRTVTFDVDLNEADYAGRPDGGAEHMSDLRSLVAYYGSGYTGPKATLNGITCRAGS